MADTAVIMTETGNKENYIDLIGFILNDLKDTEDAKDIFNYAQRVWHKKSAHRSYEPKGCSL